MASRADIEAYAKFFDRQAEQLEAQARECREQAKSLRKQIDAINRFMSIQEPSDD